MQNCNSDGLATLLAFATGFSRHIRVSATVANNKRLIRLEGCPGVVESLGIQHVDGFLLLAKKCLSCHHFIFGKDEVLIVSSASCEWNRILCPTKPRLPLGVQKQLYPPMRVNAVRDFEQIMVATLGAKLSSHVERDLPARLAFEHEALKFLHHPSAVDTDELQTHLQNNVLHCKVRSNTSYSQDIFREVLDGTDSVRHEAFVQVLVVNPSDTVILKIVGDIRLICAHTNRSSGNPHKLIGLFWQLSSGIRIIRGLNMTVRRQRACNPIIRAGFTFLARNSISGQSRGFTDRTGGCFPPLLLFLFLLLQSLLGLFAHRVPARRFLAN
mmetsp:Transcript_8907/g.23395  ORF Transcript_8907/g.23395 Transcript_8907/m.23395 type:complete len:327 (-) Transcript_8907:50-1030(-)